MNNDPYLNSLLGENEQIILVARQHWFVLFEKIATETILFVLILIGVTLAWTLVPVLAPFAPLGYLLLFLPIISGLGDVANWLTRKYVVTTRRVVQISGIFSKNVVDSSLEKVNDVMMQQSFLGRMFGYGDIEILTASELGVNRFRRIGEPVRFKTAMLNAKARLESGPGPQAVRAATNVPALIEQLDVLRRQGVLTEEEFQRKKAELLAKL
jgi:uncharacterized membrane protein YdbT with pleckstrin-like domain